MSTPEVEVNTELAEADLMATAAQVKTAQASCFSTQIASNPKVYTVSTKSALKSNIVSVRDLVAQSRQTLISRLSKTKSQIVVLRKRVDATDTQEPAVLDYMRLMQVVNSACLDSAKTSLQVREATDVLVAERRELEYRLFLASKAISGLQEEIESISGTLESLDKMKLSLG